MTPLQQTALDFCRECEGYENAKLMRNGEVERSYTPPRGFNDFRYGDFNEVMLAVRSWCDRSGCRIELHYSPEQAGFGVLCEGVDTWDEDPCHALLTACVAANRKLKGIAHE